MGDWLAYFGGRVLLEARGNQIEQFINRAHRQRIPIRSVQREADGTLRFTIPCRAFKRLREPAFKSGTRIRILKKRGFFMAVRPFKKRWGLALGLAFFLGIVFYSAGFIWQVEVIGCEKTSATQIIEELQELGLGVGCRRNIEVGPIENRYMTGNEKLSWISINIRGTTAYVEVRERGLTPEVVDLTKPSNIYAARDGIILSIMDYGGTRQVQVGEAVAAGDLLVSGEWTDQYQVRHLTRSIATVKAETRHEATVMIGFDQKIRKKTGKGRNFFAVSFGKMKISLYFTKKISYNEYDILEKVFPLRFGDFVFPIRWHHIRAEEVRSEVVTYSEEEAREMALSQLGFFEKDLLADAKVRRRELKETISAEALRIDAEFFCEEEIGIEIPIQE